MALIVTKPAQPQVVPTLCEEGLDLLAKMLRYEPIRRITARAALQHPYFHNMQTINEQHLSIA